MATSALVVTSEVPKDVLQFTWRIADFEKIRNCQKMLESLGMEIDLGAKFGLPPVKLRAYLECQEKPNGEKWIGQFFHLKNKTFPSNSPAVMIHVLIKIGNYVTARFGPYDMKNTISGPGWGWPSLLKQDEDLTKLALTPEGSLALNYEMTVFGVPKEPCLPIAESGLITKFQPLFHEKLSCDLKTTFGDPSAISTSGAPAVVTVISKDGKEFSANSSILAARSPVFHNMFQTPMSEMNKGVVNMDDIGGEALQVFLQFVHTATLHEKWKEPGIVEELACVAHKYLMLDLLDFLDEAVGLVAKPENIVKLIQLTATLEMEKAQKELLKRRQSQWTQATEMEEMMELFQE